MAFPFLYTIVWGQHRCWEDRRSAGRTKDRAVITALITANAYRPNLPRGPPSSCGSYCRNSAREADERKENSIRTRTRLVDCTRSLALSGFREGEHEGRSCPFPFDRNWPTCRSMGTGSRAGNVKPCPRCRDKRVMPSKGPAPPPGNRGSAVRLLMIPVTSRRAEFRLVQTGVSVNCLAELHSEPSSGGGRRGL